MYPFLSSDQFDEPDVYKPSTTALVPAGRDSQASAQVDQFAADMKLALDALDIDLVRGNVLAARGAALIMRVQLSVLVRALRRFP